MNSNISKDVLFKINDYIESKFGLYYPENRISDLLRGVTKASKQKNILLEVYINLLLSNGLNQEDLKNLVTFLTIGETYFFRDSKLFQTLRNNILPELINKKRNNGKSIKIWSAGCSTGEEAYSIAILMKELIPDYEYWDIKIIASDINENSLNKARRGIYSDWSFRGVDLSVKNKYFEEINDGYFKLKDNYVKDVQFHNINLADLIYIAENLALKDIDIIFCRNVLMYFSKIQIKEIINRFYNCLAYEGWFIVAPTESLFLNDASFTPVNINDVYFYNKNINERYSGNLAKNTNYKQISEDAQLINYELREKFSKISEISIYNNTLNTKLNNKLKVSLNELVKEINIKEMLTEENDKKENFEALCRSCADEGKLEEAIQWCEKAILRDKINPIYYHLLASIQQEQGELDKAVDSLKKAIFLESTFLIAYFDLGNLNLKRGKYKEACKNFKNVQALLNNFAEDEIIPYSGEMTAGMLKMVIENIDLNGERDGVL